MILPIRQQVTASDCGPTCLGMVLAAHGQHVPAAEIREAVGGASRGATAQRLAEIARHYGLLAQGARVHPDAIDQLPSGAILHWDNRHFVVFDSVKRGEFVVVDPAQGRTALSSAAFAEAFTGTAILLTPGPDFSLRAPAPSRWWHYLRLVAPLWRQVLGVIGISIAAQTVLLLGPMLSQYAIDTWMPATQDSVFILVAGMAVLGGASLLTETVRALWLIRLRQRMDRALTGGLFRHLMRLPLHFFLQRQTGDLLDRLRGHRTLRDLLAQVAVVAALDAVLVVGAMALLWSLSPTLTGVAALIASADIAVLFLTNRTREERTRTEVQARAATQALEVETLRAIESIKALGAESDMEHRWSERYNHLLQTVVQRERMDAWVGVLSRFIGFAGPMTLLLTGLVLVRNHHMTLGTVMAAWALVGSFLAPIQSLAMLITRMYTVRALLERADDILQTPVEPADTTRPLPTDAPIELRGIGYRHGAAEPWVLRDIQLTITPGEHLAIVGGSGSGKSTLMRLLSGLLSPTEGEVRVGGKDLWAGDVLQFRQRLGVVSQSPSLVAGTVYENLLLGNPDRSPNEAQEAANQAAIHGDIQDMPLGYDTHIGDGGCTLSGGQRQRIAMARALLRKPELLLLDEATSALDTITERTIQDSIVQLQCTRVVVAHRLSTVCNADRIIVLEHGQIVGIGTHAHLLTDNAPYRALWTAQSEPSPRPNLALTSMKTA